MEYFNFVKVPYEGVEKNYENMKLPVPSRAKPSEPLETLLAGAGRSPSFGSNPSTPAGDPLARLKKAEAEGLEANLADLRRQRDELQRALADLRQTSESLARERDEQRSNFQRALEELGTKEQVLEGLRAEIRDLRSGLEKVDLHYNRLSDLDAELARLRSENGRLQRDALEAAAQLAAARQATARLQADADVATPKLRALAADAARAAQLEREISIMRQNFLDLEDKNHELLRQVEKLVDAPQKISQFESLNRALQLEVDRLEDQNKNFFLANEKIEELENDLLREKSRAATAQAESNSRLLEKDAQIKDLQLRLVRQLEGDRGVVRSEPGYSPMVQSLQLKVEELSDELRIAKTALEASERERERDRDRERERERERERAVNFNTANTYSKRYTEFSTNEASVSRRQENEDLEQEYQRLKKDYFDLNRKYQDSLKSQRETEFVPQVVTFASQSQAGRESSVAELAKLRSALRQLESLKLSQDLQNFLLRTELLRLDRLSASTPAKEPRPDPPAFEFKISPALKSEGASRPSSAPRAKTSQNLASTFDQGFLTRVDRSSEKVEIVEVFHRNGGSRNLDPLAESLLQSKISEIDKLKKERDKLLTYVDLYRGNTSQIETKMKKLMEKHEKTLDLNRFLQGQLKGTFDGQNSLSELKELQMKNRLLEIENKRVHEMLLERMRQLEAMKR